MTMSVQQMQLILEQKVQEAIQKTNQEQNLAAIAPNVLAALHDHVNGLLGSTVGASVGATAPQGQGSVGASAPKPKGSLGDDPFQPSGNGGYAYQLAIDIENVYQNPNDPTAVAALINYMAQLQKNGQLNNPDVQKMLAQFNMTANGPAMINELIEYTYFMEGGKAGAQTLINQLMSQFSGSSSDPTIQAIQAQLASWNSAGLAQFDSQHDNNGQLYWNIPIPNGNGTYITLNWNGQYATDNFAILQIIGNQNGGIFNSPNPYINGLGPNPQSWLQSFLSQYRTSAINQIWDKTHNLGLLIMELMQLYDGDDQSQQGGLANTTNLLSDMTDKYANQMITCAQQMGSLTTADTDKFMHLLLVGSAVMQMESQFGSSTGVASDWNDNVYTPIMNQAITFGSPPTNSTVGVEIQKYLNGDQSALQNLTDGLNNLNTTPNGADPGPQPGFQAIVNALQSGSGLLTGQSKTVSTQLSLVTNLETQLIKLGNSNATSDGGGWVQMISAILNNQVSH